MKTEDYRDRRWNSWEEQLDRALKNLPEMTAPTNLTANVMAAIKKRETEKSPNLPFPFGHSWLRVTAVVLAFSLAAYLFFIGQRIYENAIRPAFTLAGSVCRTVIGSFADIPAQIPLAIGDGALPFLLPILICLMLAMYLTCIGVGTFIYRTVRR